MNLVHKKAGNFQTLTIWRQKHKTIFIKCDSLDSILDIQENSFIEHQWLSVIYELVPAETMAIIQE